MVCRCAARERFALGNLRSVAADRRCARCAPTQDGLYTLCTLDERVSYQIIGSTREYLVAREESEAVLNRIAAPTTRVITATITEKGYCLAAGGGLDFNHEDVRHDLDTPDRPCSFIGFL